MNDDRGVRDVRALVMPDGRPRRAGEEGVGLAGSASTLALKRSNDISILAGSLPGSACRARRGHSGNRLGKARFRLAVSGRIAVFLTPKT